MKICQTKPIFNELKISLTPYTTKDYGNNSGLFTMEKQSQNKPKQSQFIPNGKVPKKLDFPLDIEGAGCYTDFVVLGVRKLTDCLRNFYTPDVYRPAW